MFGSGMIEQGAQGNNQSETKNMQCIRPNLGIGIGLVCLLLLHISCRYDTKVTIKIRYKRSLWSLPILCEESQGRLRLFMVGTVPH